MWLGVGKRREGRQTLSQPPYTSSTRSYRSWDTIRMVPTPATAGQNTSLDSQPNHDHAVFQNPELVPEEVRTFVGKPPVDVQVLKDAIQKQNPQVPGMMSPK